MHGEQADRIGTARRGCADATGLERSHERIRRGITRAIDLERHPGQRPQIGQHLATQRRRCGRGEAREHVALVEDRIQRIVRRQPVDQRFPAQQIIPRHLQGRAFEVWILQQLEPRKRPPRALHAACVQGELHQLLVRDAEQRRLQRTSQRQVVRRRHQGVQQGGDVLHFGGLAEVGLFRLLGRNVQRPQLLLHHGQPVSPPGKHHDLAGQDPLRDLLRDPGGGLPAFQGREFFLGQFTRDGETVAPQRLRCRRNGHRLA